MRAGCAIYMVYGVEKIMINEKMENAFNEQINREFYSAFLYLSMSGYLMDLGLNGFANWMRVQYQEENAHAHLMLDYLLSRNGKLVLKPIEAPQNEWQNVLSVFEHVLRHEEHVTSLINGVIDVAQEMKDRAAEGYLQWFIKEQVEEEANASDIIAKLKLINSEGNALFMMDKEMGLRTFV